jgi:hypothetical protein
MATVTPQPDDEPQRLGVTHEFAAELRRLAEIAPTKQLAEELLRLIEVDE